MTNPIGPVPIRSASSSGVKTVNEPMVFTGPVEFQQLPKEYVDYFEKGSTTPNVANCCNFVTYNTGAVLVTDFLNGADAQTIKILGDGFTSITNGTKIKTNTGANKLLAANKVYTFTRFNNVWYEAE